MESLPPPTVLRFNPPNRENAFAQELNWKVHLEVESTVRLYALGDRPDPNGSAEAKNDSAINDLHCFKRVMKAGALGRGAACQVANSAV